ncbi:MAG: PAS domain S-box protein [Deltaproteobacteria bacterium]|nr:PAS domain S-box protein [Deltaproteobacteria bacterium]
MIETINRHLKNQFRIALVAVLAAVSISLLVYFHVRGMEGTSVAHFFDVPVVLAALWWKRKGIIVPAFLSVGMIMSSLIFHPEDLAGNVIGAAMIMLVGAAVAVLSEKWSRTEQALSSSEKRLNTILEGSPIPTLVIDDSHNIIYWNHAIEALTGMSAISVVGRRRHARALYGEDRPTLADLLVDNQLERVPQLYDDKHGQSKFIDGAYEANGFFPKVGEKGKWLKATAKVLIDASGQVIGAVETLEDITDRKRQEQKIREHAEALEISNQELEKFAYVASHDLQEPLRMVASYVQLLSKRYKGKLDNDADDFINFAVDGAKRMQKLISDLLEYSRVGRRGRYFEETDCEEILATVMKSLDHIIRESGAVVTHDPLPTIMADPIQIGQLFQNLISNAIKFRSMDEPQIHISVKHDMDGANWIFSLSDNGIGIDPAYHDRIFEIFQRLQRADRYSGTGIGLAICKKIIDRHCGKIWVESSPGKGATFFFTIPFVKPSYESSISEPRKLRNTTMLN